MSTEEKCPFCDRPPGKRQPYAGEETGECHAWYIIARSYPSPSGSDIEECWRHAKPWRETAQRLELELADTKAKLAAAQRSLSRRHEAAQPIATAGRTASSKLADMFPDDARIE